MGWGDGAGGSKQPGVRPHGTGLGARSTLPVRVSPTVLFAALAGDPDPVLRCIVSGFFANAARFHSTGAYR